MLPNSEASSTPVTGLFIQPDDRERTDFLQDFELGGVAIGDASQGSRVKVWKAWYDGHTVLLAPESDLTQTTTLFVAEGVTELSLAFDQLMHPNIAYLQDGLVKLWWYDPTIAAPTTLEVLGAVSPMLTLDDKRDTQRNTSDVLFFYIQDNTRVCYRMQRDRYTVEYDFASLAGARRIKRVGMSSSGRLQLEVQAFRQG